jgi:hypothetical protein
LNGLSDFQAASRNFGRFRRLFRRFRLGLI